MDTAQIYTARYAQLRRRFLRNNQTESWDAFISWLIALRPTLRPASYRQYRAAVAYVLRQSDIDEAPELLDRLQHEGEPGNRRALPLRTSSSKAKSLRVADQNRLLQHLNTHDGSWNRLTAHWLIWGMVCGLRPVEWASVRLQTEPGGVALLVRNAKRTQGRAHGDTRTVHLSLQARHIQMLQEFVRAVQQDYDKAYRACRCALYRAVKTLWPRRKRRPSLYTGRHQFTATAKAAGLPPDHIAALMGHAVIQTHQAHYGKRRCGHGALRAMADAQDVQRVRQRAQLQQKGPKWQPESM